MSGPPEITVRLAGDGECDIVHARTGVTLRTSMSPVYGGRGSSFSSTDLVAVALATCIATSLEPVALRQRIALERIAISAAKTLATGPKRLAAITVRITVEAELTAPVVARLRRAADACAVHRSLNPAVEVSIEIETGARESSDRS